MNFKEGTPLKVFFVLFLGMFLSISCSSASEDINLADHDNGICGVHDNKCGPVALQKSLETQGKTVTVDELVKQSQTDKTGTNMHGMIKAAKQNGVDLYGVELPTTELQKDDITLLNTDDGYHYTIITEINKETVTIHNPPLQMGLNEFEKVYTGYALTNQANQGRLLNHDELQTINGNDWIDDTKNTVNNAVNTVKQGIQRIAKAVEDVNRVKTEQQTGVGQRFGFI